MSETVTIRINTPLACCRPIAIQRRCGEMTTLIRVTRLSDGSYHMQPYCWHCAMVLGLAAPVTTKGDE